MNITELKNDKLRHAFLDGYRNTENGWYLWKSDNELDQRYWRYDLPKCAFIVQEQLHTVSWPTTKQIYSVRHWYIIRDWQKPFWDQQGSRTLALEALKKAQKEVTQ